MFNIAGTIGNGNDMVSAGLSIKVGQANHVSVSRVAMAKEIIELRKALEDQRSFIADSVAGNVLDLSKSSCSRIHRRTTGLMITWRHWQGMGFWKGIRTDILKEPDR